MSEITVYINRDCTLFSAERIKREFLALLATCSDTEERVGYLRCVGYHGYIGDGGFVARDRESAEYFVRRLDESSLIELMYSLCVRYFETRPKKALCLSGGSKSIDNSGVVVTTTTPDHSFLYVGRSDSINDWHYRLRCRLYGFTDDIISEMPFSGIAVKRRCHWCGSEQWPMIVCVRCRDVNYCDTQCQMADWLLHQDYCQESIFAQKMYA